MSKSEEMQLKEEKLLVSEVQSDFKRRQEERRAYERGWQLNMNFISGNQPFIIFALVGEIMKRSYGTLSS